MVGVPNAPWPLLKCLPSRVFSCLPEIKMLLLYKFSLQVGSLKEEYQHGFQWTSTGLLDLFLYFSLEKSACLSSELLIYVFGHISIIWYVSLHTHVCMLNCFSRVQLFATLWTLVHQAPLFRGFSRQEYWSGLPYPSPGESSWPRDRTHIIYTSCIGRQILYH